MCAWFDRHVHAIANSIAVCTANIMRYSDSVDTHEKAQCTPPLVYIMQEANPNMQPLQIHILNNNNQWR